MKQRFLAGLGGVIALFGTGCSGAFEGSDELAGEGEVVDERPETYTTVGVRRVIPIRLLRIRDCHSPTATDESCYTNSSYEQALDNVQAANQAFRSAGVQFWLRAYDDIEAPHFWEKHKPTTDLTWCEV